MRLQKLHDFKHWHLGHTHGHPLELWVCDSVLAAWVAGWMLLPVLALIDAWPLLPGSLGLTLFPTTYWWLRARLHRRGVLRCDWLHTVR